MTHKILIVIVLILLAIVVVSFALQTASNYCTCTGLGTSVNEPPLNLWGAGDTSQPQQKSTGYAQQDTAYDPSVWSVVDANKSGCMCDYGSSMAVKKLVPLSTVNAVLPPGTVSDNKVSYPLRRGFEYRGLETAPSTTHRYGAYADAYDPDVEIGVM